MKAADFSPGQARKTQEYFVYFKVFWRGAGGKDALSAGEAYQGFVHNKREQGEFLIRPAWTPVSL